VVGEAVSQSGYSSWKIATLALLCAWATSGCAGSAEPGIGAIGVVWQNPSGTTQTDRNATYDFGSLFIGQTKTMKVVIRNLGSGNLSLKTLEKAEGESVRIGDTDFGDSPTFRVAFFPTTIPPGEAVEFDATYTAPFAPPVDHEVKLLLIGDNTPAGENIALIDLKARAVTE
jgi:hypothetical protein